MSINWANLVTKGRAKAIGIPWSDEEAHAIYELKIPAEYVRDGILTLEAYEKAKAKDEKKGAPTSRQTRKQLEKAAKQLKIAFTPEVDDVTLAAAIKQAKAKAKDDKKANKSK